jgi:carbonic anhydrase
MGLVPGRRSFLGFAAAMAACPLCATSATAAEAHGSAPHWGYEGENGPANWSELSPNFRSCSLGAEQTPIDLKGAISAKSGPVDIAYRRVPLTILNNGHTIQVNTPPGSKLRISGTTYELLQFHFHHPSEHLLAGKHFDMEIHFVHKAANGALAVVGVFIKPGATNSALAPIWAAMPAHEAEPGLVADVTINPAQLLPKVHDYFRYMGSLTTPPCSEGLTWTMFRTPIQASTAQIQKFAALFPLNARPTQPLNRRFLLQS